MIIVPLKTLVAYYTGSNFASSIRHNEQCCELFSLIDLNTMSNTATPAAMPSVVMLPQAEWEGIKDLLNEVKDTLQTRSAEEVNSQWIESTEARKMLGVSAKTWQDYRDKRVIPFSQFGRKIYVRRADIEAFMKQHYISAKQ